MVVIEKLNEKNNEKKLSQKQFDMLTKNKQIFEGTNVNILSQNNSPNVVENNLKTDKNSPDLENLQQFLPILNLLQNKDDKSAVSEFLMKQIFGDNPLLTKLFDIIKTNNKNNENTVVPIKKEEIKISSFKRTDESN